MTSVGAGEATAEARASVITQRTSSTVTDSLHECLQPNITRSKSSNFHVQYNFIRDSPGRLNDDYMVQAEALGKGSFGSAHMVVCKATGFMRAVKSIDLKRVKKPKRLESEVAIAKQLDHPNVVRLFETFRDDDVLHLVMELCTGGELFDRIVAAGPGGVGEPSVAKYVHWMTAALSYMHARNICHRDVKPENSHQQINVIEICMQGPQTETSQVRTMEGFKVMAVGDADYCLAAKSATDTCKRTTLSALPQQPMEIKPMVEATSMTMAYSSSDEVATQIHQCETGPISIFSYVGSVMHYISLSHDHLHPGVAE